MATVTGLTAARMQEIIDATIVTATVVGSDLVLTTSDGTDIVAGSVAGPMGPAGGAFVICTSSTHPSWSGIDEGKAIYETDTNLIKVWTGARFRVQERIVCTSSTRPTLGTDDEGTKIYETDTGLEYTWSGTAWKSPLDGFIDIGMEMIWPGLLSAIPSMFMNEDGRLLLRASYPELFAVLGTTWNTGGESGSQFRIPNSRDKVVVGAGSTYAVGTYGGANSSAISLGELPTHTHTEATHTHTMGTTLVAAGTGVVVMAPGGAGSSSTGFGAGAGTGNAGSSTARSNMQAYAAKYVLIRAF